jgi:hypothetical protein
MLRLIMQRVWTGGRRDVSDGNRTEPSWGIFFDRCDEQMRFE